jgi:hypothetical protein
MRCRIRLGSKPEHCAGLKWQASKGGSTAHAALTVFSPFQKHHITHRLFSFIWIMERIEVWCAISLALSIPLAVWYWDPAWHCETMCSLQSKCFWQRCNVSWPFRRQPRSGHKVLCTAVCSVRELKYADNWVCKYATQYLPVDCNVSVPCLMSCPWKRSFYKQVQLLRIAKCGTYALFSSGKRGQ